MQLSNFERQFYKSTTVCELPFLYPTKIGQGLLVRYNEANEKAYLDYLDTLPKVVINEPGGLVREASPAFDQKEYLAWLNKNTGSPELQRLMLNVLLIPDGHDTPGGEVYDFMPTALYEEITGFLLESFGAKTSAGTQSPKTSGGSTKTKTRAKVLKPR